MMINDFFILELLKNLSVTRVQQKSMLYGFRFSMFILILAITISTGKGCL